jgi:hypothetical protein
MNRTKKACRLIVVRRPYQQELFGQESNKLRYEAIASSRTDAADVVQYHRVLFSVPE